MQEPRSPRPFPFGLLAGFTLLLLTTGSTVALWTWHSTSTHPTPPTATNPQPSEPAAAASPSAKSPVAAMAPSTAVTPVPPKSATALPAPTPSGLPQAYWVKDTGSKVALVPDPITASAQSPNQKAAVALQTLLAGPNQAGVTTTIPKDTKLRSVTVKPDGIHVDLSQNFVQGGGSASMTARVGQVLYTVTSDDPQAPVWFSVEGKPVKNLGGEGLVLDGPLTRQEFEKDFPQ